MLVFSRFVVWLFAVRFDLWFIRLLAAWVWMFYVVFWLILRVIAGGFLWVGLVVWVIWCGDC